MKIKAHHNILIILFLSCLFFSFTDHSQGGEADLELWDQSPEQTITSLAEAGMLGKREGTQAYQNLQIALSWDAFLAMIRKPSGSFRNIAHAITYLVGQGASFFVVIPTRAMLERKSILTDTPIFETPEKFESQKKEALKEFFESFHRMEMPYLGKFCYYINKHDQESIHVLLDLSDRPFVHLFAGPPTLKGKPPRVRLSREDDLSEAQIAFSLMRRYPASSIFISTKGEEIAAFRHMQNRLKLGAEQQLSATVLLWTSGQSHRGPVRQTKIIARFFAQVKHEVRTSGTIVQALAAEGIMTQFMIENVEGNGDCAFTSLARVTGKDINRGELIRRLRAKLEGANSDHFMEILASAIQDHFKLGPLVPWEEYLEAYLEALSKSEFWLTDYELHLVAYFWELTINVFLPAPANPGVMLYTIINPHLVVDPGEEITPQVANIILFGNHYAAAHPYSPTPTHMFPAAVPNASVPSPEAPRPLLFTPFSHLPPSFQ
ncbi:MAG: hypothetical protein KA436_00295 [Oligoflexales bacterium]|nr:hypothetical protein [Oligoflexales bacterium]